MILEGRRAIKAMASVPRAVPLLALRVALFTPVFMSGWTRYGEGGSLAAAGAVQMGLAVLLLIGLGTRYAALGLMVLIALAVMLPERWADQHLPWGAMAFALLAFGGGGWSAEGLIPSAGPKTRARPRDDD